MLQWHIRSTPHFLQELIQLFQYVWARRPRGDASADCFPEAFASVWGYRQLLDLRAWVWAGWAEALHKSWDSHTAGNKVLPFIICPLAQSQVGILVGWQKSSGSQIWPIDHPIEWSRPFTPEIHRAFIIRGQWLHCERFLWVGKDPTATNRWLSSVLLCVYLHLLNKVFNSWRHSSVCLNSYVFRKVSQILRQNLKCVLKCFHGLYLRVQKLTALSSFINGMEKKSH